MATKRDPGQYDCYAKLADDEPFFVLRAKDPTAPEVINTWCMLSQQTQPVEKLAEAHKCASEMKKWRQQYLAEQGDDGQNLVQV